MSSFIIISNLPNIYSTALSDLNMNGFKITDNSTDLTLQSNNNIFITSASDCIISGSQSEIKLTNNFNVQAGDVEIGSGAGGFYRCGNNTVAGVGAEIVADDGISLEAIGGSVSINAQKTKIQSAIINKYTNTADATYNILETDYTIIQETSGSTVNLPTITATNVGQSYYVINTSIGNITLASPSSQTIYRKNGLSGTSITLNAGNAYMLQAIPLTTAVSTFGWIAI